ncbi:MAG: hypothetical protein IPL53_19780 [Ignavibacteria bacterium]|nr:hypothetical protein [Ignavibacteria bacterium]
MVKKLFLLFYFGLTLASVAQNKTTQKYIYENDQIKLEVATDKIEFFSLDTLVMKIKIENVSSENIFVFKKPRLIIVKGKDSTWTKIVLNYKYDYFSDFETWEEMYAIEPNDFRKFKLKISIDSLLKIGYKNSIRMNFGIGYISSINDIKKYQYLTTIKPKYKEDSIIVSAKVLNAALKREAFEIFGITLSSY